MQQQFYPKPAVNCVTEESPQQPGNDPATPLFSPEHYYQIQQMIQRGSMEPDIPTTASLTTVNNVDLSHNASGSNTGTLLALLSHLDKVQWVIDTGATNHMVLAFNILKKPQQLSKHLLNYLPNGEQANIIHTGSVTILTSHQIADVLYIPKFKFNLLYVPKLTKELQCLVSFILIIVCFRPSPVARY